MSETTPSPDFIEVYPDAVPAAACDIIRQAFDDSDAKRDGQVGGGVHKDLKDSLDITITGRPEWVEVEQMLNQAALQCFVRYLRAYPHTLLAPLMLQHQPEGGGAPRRLAAEDLEQMDDQTLADIAMATVRPGGINLQRYTADRGGYPYWHCELMPKDATAETLHRHVLWTVYLNDDFDEGGTEFLYQRRLVEARKGALLIAPAAFTHTHRGNRPLRRDKYIATSWLLFRRGEEIFGR